jgi:hypothetical protein
VLPTQTPCLSTNNGLLPYKGTHLKFKIVPSIVRCTRTKKWGNFTRSIRKISLVFKTRDIQYISKLYTSYMTEFKMAPLLRIISYEKRKNKEKEQHTIKKRKFDNTVKTVLQPNLEKMRVKLS